MKYISFLIALLLLSCSEPKYRSIGQEIIDGKVSAIQAGTGGRVSNPPKIWVQNATNTQEIDIPFEYEGRWKVGDSCLLIIQKYEIIKEE